MSEMCGDTIDSHSSAVSERPTLDSAQGASLSWLLPQNLLRQRWSLSLSKVSCRNVQKYHTAQNIDEVDKKDLLPPRIRGLRWRTLNEDSASRSRPVERGRSLNTWRTIQIWPIEMQCARLCLDNMHFLCFYAAIQGKTE